MRSVGGESLEECRRQECRSVDNSFDYDKQEDTMQAAHSSTLLSEASLLHSYTP